MKFLLFYLLILTTTSLANSYTMKVSGGDAVIKIGAQIAMKAHANDTLLLEPGTKINIEKGPGKIIIFEDNKSIATLIDGMNSSYEIPIQGMIKTILLSKFDGLIHKISVSNYSRKAGMGSRNVSDEGPTIVLSKPSPLVILINTMPNQSKISDLKYILHLTTEEKSLYSESSKEGYFKINYQELSQLCPQTFDYEVLVVHQNEKPQSVENGRIILQ